MKTTDRRNKIIAATSTALFFVALIAMMIIHDSNRSLEEMLNGAKLKNETVLSEKLALDKEINDYKKQLAALQGKNKELDKFLATANADLAKKESQLKVAGKNTSNTKELANLRKMRSDLENQVSALVAQIASLEGANSDLTQQIASLTNKNQDLKSSNDLMKAFAANNYRMETSRGKSEKLTVVARKTKKLKMGFDLPQNVVENVQFKITMPDGSVIDKEEDGLTATLLDIEDGSDLMVSLEPMGDFEVTRRIEMKYEPKKKLSKGVYTIDIYNGDTYMVSCQVKLR
ncbi:hypothetical protein Oweho_2066 [Owenweeksia hongkongensis DSM 17368]|uniref:Uncharacterized protein n=1 Tax=Owenweeksia hongkongensis (strain DSM 17368 / CIP 108786 / JCM 12287 / NRRL B-23963 / UST20020801) TaxID=926562 RepID=G8R3I6_OWEHD|nr:hypothetical protein [Owenweeksia hongkongensis]AEV33042.1 hypothetical protein Oweho_2066 [Owenweeksia hongkongensis DSM 17368]